MTLQHPRVGAGGYRLTCDRCHVAEGPAAEGADLAVRLALAAGWRRGEYEARPRWRRLGDLCPGCASCVEAEIGAEHDRRKESVG